MSNHVQLAGLPEIGQTVHLRPGHQYEPNFEASDRSDFRIVKIWRHEFEIGVRGERRHLVRFIVDAT